VLATAGILQSNLGSSGVNFLGKHPTVSNYHSNNRSFSKEKEKWVQISDKQQ